MNEPKSKVGVSARFVPAGLERRNGKLVGRGVVVLSPVAGDLSRHPLLVFSEWPKAIEEWLDASSGGGLKLHFGVVSADGDARPMPEEARVVYARRSAAAAPAAETTRIDDLWRSLMARCDADWTQLICALDTTDKKSFCECLSKPDAEGVAPASAGGGGGAKPAAPEPDVVSTARSDSALMLTLERGRSVLERIRVPDDGTPDKPDRYEERLRTRSAADLFSRRWSAASRPWLPTAAPLIRLAAEGSAAGLSKEKSPEELAKDQRELEDRKVGGSMYDRRMAASEQAKGYAVYRGAATRSKAKDALISLAGVQPKGPKSPSESCAAAAAQKCALDESLNEARAMHFAASRPEVRKLAVAQDPTTELSRPELLKNRFFMLHSQPMLARLFNFVIDVEFDVDDKLMETLLAAGEYDEPNLAELGRTRQERKCRFLFVAASFRGRRSPERLIWTTAKLRLPAKASKDGSVGHFWPCTREELDARTAGLTEEQLLSLGIASQIDGLLDLGASSKDNGVRFDLVTLDVVQAIEGDVRTSYNAASAASVQLDAPTPVTSHATGGLILVDRWRQSQVIGRLTAGQARRDDSSSKVVVDAEDLTVGYEIDLALRSKTRTSWRSLMNRRIVFGSDLDPDKTAWVESALNRFATTRAERLRLDSSSCALATRMREGSEVDQTYANGTHTAYAEEIVAQWDGSPMGVDPDSGRTSLAKACMPQLSQVHTLIADDKALKPPRQIFGWPYHIGARARFAGGVSVPVAYAAEVYEKVAEGRFALPPAGESRAGRRLLRHERIEAPFVATPLDILKRATHGPRETSRTLVVRSSSDPEKSPPLSRLGPDSTHRIVLPPAVELEFAAKHGVFQDPKKVETVQIGAERIVRPIGGLGNVDYDRALTGGFPQWSTVEDSDGAECARVCDPLARKGPTAGGEAIFRSKARSGAQGDRPKAYYPDPAAEFLIVRARAPGWGVLPGAPLVVPLYPSGAIFPDVRPVMIDVLRVETRSGIPATQERLLALDMGKGRYRSGQETFADAKAAAAGKPNPPATVLVDGGEAPARSGVAVTRVCVRLEPGEDYELDLWCAPSAKCLIDWFDVIDSAALVLAAFADHDPAACADPATIMHKSAEFLQKDLSALRALALATDCSFERPGETGAGQRKLPGGIRGIIAAQIQDAMLRAVFPEIAARTTLRVAHAVTRPQLKPNTASPDKAHEQLRLVRLSSETVAAVLADDSSDHRLASPATWTDETAEDDARDMLFGGEIGLDTETTRFVELHGRGACLINGAFDDERKGRTPDQRSRGIWPRSPDGRPLKPMEVYGFDVRPDGRAILPVERGVLLRIDDLENVDPNARRAGLESVDLLDIQRRAFKNALDDRKKKDEQDAKKDGSASPAPPLAGSSAGRLRVSAPDRIRDAKARVLEVSVLAGSRTAPLIWEQDGRALSADKQGLESSTIRMALPATARPARVAPVTVMPSFRWDGPSEEGGAVTLRRTAHLRIRMKRPWFSSGEGERLGVVLWPPQLIDSGVVNREGTRVARDYHSQSISMAPFSDLDLGPGGAFVTRWGHDPTKAGPRSNGWLMTPAQFRDVPKEVIDDARAPRPCWSPLDPDAGDTDVVYVPRVEMPLPSMKNAVGAPTDGKAPSGREPTTPPELTLTVALLTFAPRFDIDEELWYVDLEIDSSIYPERFVRLGLVRYQPNAPRRLQVSEPVVEWAQLLPERKVKARNVGGAAGSGYEVEIEVCGPQAFGEALSPGYAPTDWLATSAMQMCVLRSDGDNIESFATDADGEAAACERLPATSATRPLDDPRHVKLAQPITSTGAQWSQKFRLAEDPDNPSTPGVSYSAFVAEVQMMRPATYMSEPFEPEATGANDALVATGPRFAARLPLTKRDLENARPLAARRSASFGVHQQAGTSQCSTKPR